MGGLIVRWIVNAIALIVVCYVVPGVAVTSWTGLAISALVLGLINAIIRPILLIIAIPLEIVTLGLFALVINAFLFWLVAQFHIGLVVSGWGAAFWGGLVLWIVSWILSIVTRGMERA